MQASRWNYIERKRNVERKRDRGGTLKGETDREILKREGEGRERRERKKAEEG